MSVHTAHLWRLAKDLINTLFRIFGEPQEIARRGAVDRKTHRWLIAWLYACETLLRRLLLIEANALAPLGPPASGRRSLQHTSKLGAISFDPDDWRVSFRCTDAYGAPASRRPASAHAGETPAPHIPAWPLAHRAEALYRVAKNPLPYARRLARLIARTPQALAHILAPPRQRKRKSGDPPNAIDIIGHEPWREVGELSPNTS